MFLYLDITMYSVHYGSWEENNDFLHVPRHCFEGYAPRKNYYVMTDASEGSTITSVIFFVKQKYIARFHITRLLFIRRKTPR